MTTTIPDTVVVSALQSQGVITASGGVVGNVTGGLTGNGAGTWTGPVVGNVTGNASGLALGLQVMSADGAITLLSGTVLITKTSLANITIAPPTPGTDDGKILVITSTTAFGHIITQGSVGFNAKGASGTATFAAAKGNSIVLQAYNGNWYQVGAAFGVTIA